MPALFVFLLKVNAAMLLFCAGYYLVLRHLTFYTLNRVYLMGAIVFATVYPQINLDAFFQRHQQLAQPVYVVVENFNLPQQLAQPAYWTWLEVIFFAGVALLAIKLCTQLFSLYKVYRASRKEEIHGHEVRVVNSDGGPFSFWKSIYVNPTGYTESDLRAILKHEQIHTDEWHTIDILLAELSVIFYWFNPGVWLMRKAVRENIEFITDRKILQQGADSKQYQYSLLNVSFSNSKPGIANHFNISTLKKRILMMNAKRSSNINLSRYLLLVPMLLVMLLCFSVTRAAIVKTTRFTYTTITSSVHDAVLDNPVSDRIREIFRDSMKNPVAAKKQDTIKIIRVGKKDTIKIISSNISIPPPFQLSYQNDSTKTVKVLNFLLDTNTHKIAHVRIDGKDYAPTVVGETKVYKLITSDTSRHFLITRDSIKTSGKIVGSIQLKASPATILVDGKAANVSSQNHTTELLKAVDGFNIAFAMAPDSSKQKVSALLKRMDGFSVNSDGSVTKEVDGKPVIFNKRFSPVIVWGKANNQETAIKINDLPIMIDGVEANAKELRKKASDIDVVVRKGGPEIVKQYGEKAKNGMIFITTKKDK